MIDQGAASTPTRKRLLWKVLSGSVLAVALLAILFYRINVNELAQAFSTISVWHIAGAYLFRLAAVVFRSMRWRRLGVAHQRATALDCLSANANGMLIGLAVPGLSEFTRAYVLKRRARVPFGSVLGVLTAERVIDTLLLLAVVLFIFLVVPGIRWLTVATAVLAVAAAVVVALVVVFVATRHSSARRIEQALSRFSPRLARRVAGFIEHFAHGVRRLGELRTHEVLAIIALSILLWLSHTAFAYLVFLGFGDHLALGFEAGLFTAAMVYFGMIIRLTPAGLGQYHLVIVIALGAFGVASGLARIVSLVLHGVTLLVTLSLGVPFLYREHLGLARLAREKEVTGEETALPGGGPA